jgi:hypothetical protein
MVRQAPGNRAKRVFAICPGRPRLLCVQDVDDVVIEIIEEFAIFAWKHPQIHPQIGGGIKIALWRFQSYRGDGRAQGGASPSPHASARSGGVGDLENWPHHKQAALPSQE